MRIRKWKVEDVGRGFELFDDEAEAQARAEEAADGEMVKNHTRNQYTVSYPLKAENAEL
jgi:hypothetical protein